MSATNAAALKVVELVKLIAAELDDVGSDVLLDPAHAACAGGRGYVRAARLSSQASAV